MTDSQVQTKTELSVIMEEEGIKDNSDSEKEVNFTTNNIPQTNYIPIHILTATKTESEKIKNQDATSWRLVEASGCANGILTTFIIHYYRYQLLSPILFYSGGIFGLSAFAFGLLNVKRTGMSFTNFCVGLFNGMNVATNHLVFFLLPIGIYGIFTKVFAHK